MLNHIDIYKRALVLRNISVWLNFIININDSIENNSHRKRFSIVNSTLWFIYFSCARQRILQFPPVCLGTSWRWEQTKLADRDHLYPELRKLGQPEGIQDERDRDDSEAQIPGILQEPPYCWWLYSVLPEGDPLPLSVCRWRKGWQVPSPAQRWQVSVKSCILIIIQYFSDITLLTHSKFAMKKCVCLQFLVKALFVYKRKDWFLCQKQQA